MNLSVTKNGYKPSDGDVDYLKTEYNHGIYRKTTTSIATWLSSPSSLLDDSRNVVFIDEGNGYDRGVWTYYPWKVRPIVCIKTPVFEEKYEATLESNYIGEAINADKYGEEVIGYECTDADAQKEAGAWRLFYQNKYYTYLISDNKIELSNLQNLYTTAGWDAKTGADVSDVGQCLNSMFKDAGGFTSENTYKNIKATGYLTDPEQWTKYKGPDAIFAIGGPTLELFAESFKAAGKAAKDGRKTIEISVVDAYGYKVSMGSHLETTQNHGIYRKEDGKPYWWISAPGSGQSDRILLVQEYDGVVCLSYLGQVENIRPIVCIPTNTFNEKYKLAEIVTEGLMRYYDATNNLGNGKHSDTTTTWKDLSGHQDGIINGGANFTEDCLQLDGEDDWVNLGEVNTNYMTWEINVEIVSFLFSDESNNWYRFLIGNWQIGGGGIDTIKGKACAEIYINGGKHTVYSDKILETGKKYNFTCTYDGQSIKLYIDGELQSEGKVSGTIDKPQDSTVMGIGTNPDGNVRPKSEPCSAMKVYSARIYDRALTQEEIQQNIKAENIIN